MLLVEDDERAARLLQRFLRASGLEGEHVSSKTAALRALRTQASWRGFVLDVRLGSAEYDGLEVLERIALAFPSAPRVMVSGVIEGFVINRARRYGAGFICKPFVSDDLESFAFEALDVHRRCRAAQAPRELGPKRPTHSGPAGDPRAVRRDDVTCAMSRGR